MSTACNFNPINTVRFTCTCEDVFFEWNADVPELSTSCPCCSPHHCELTLEVCLRKACFDSCSWWFLGDTKRQKSFASVAFSEWNEIMFVSLRLLLLLRRVGHGHLLPALWEALPDPDGAAAAHGSPRRRSQLHLQRMQPDFPQPYCTEASPTLAHRSVEAVVIHLHYRRGCSLSRRSTGNYPSVHFQLLVVWIMEIL